jgi:hypothetical protein
MNPEERDIKEAMEQMRSDTPAELKARLRLLASSAKVRRPSPWPARLAFAGAAATLVAIIAISLSPSDASAKSFDMVVNATRQARAFSFEATRYQGDKANHMWVASSDGRIVMRASAEAVMLMDSATMKMYNPRSNVVSVMPLGGFGNGAMMFEIFRQGVAQMDVHNMLENWRRQYGDANITVGPIRRGDGRKLYDVTLLRSGIERVHLTVDADTDLPAHIESERAQGPDWKKDMVMDVRYGEDVDLSLLNYTVPANAKVTQLNFSTMGAAMKSMNLGSGRKPSASSAKVNEMIGKMLEGFGKRPGVPSDSSGR